VTTDIAALKTRLKATWEAGDFGQIAQYSQSAADEFVVRRKLRPWQKVLDVACGTGNLAIPAAKAGAVVTGSDIASNLVAQARARARAEGVQAQFEEGDAEQMAYADGSFDVVLTQFGAMFAPRPERAAAEMIRVCRPGGEIAMGNWTPNGFIGQMFLIKAFHVPPPPGMAPPVLWGDEGTVRERLHGVTQLRLRRFIAVLHYPYSVPDLVEFYRQFFGPTKNAFAALDTKGQAALRRDLEDLWARNNTATDGGTRVEAEYLEVSCIRE
jgi:ubiquinone/menaquinone biosynthesis C-methylase UbiE